MKKELAFAMLAVFASVGMEAADYDIDVSHSNVNFEVDHLAFSTVKGRFEKFSGSFSTDPKSGAVMSLKGSVESASISTDNEKRDKHLRSDDFFSSEKFSTLSLQFPKISVAPGKSERVTGELTIRDIKKQVPFDVSYRGAGKDPWGTEKAGLRMTAEINRKDFGLGWNQILETGGVLVGEKVKIEVNLQGNKKENLKEKK